MSTALCKSLTETTAMLYHCEDAGEFYRVHTPCLYPDGDVIEVYCKAVGDSVEITDLGETVNWLLSNVYSGKLTNPNQQLIGRMASLHGVELDQGCIRTRAPLNALAEGVSRVAQAASRASDISFTYKPRSLTRTAEEVADFLKQNLVDFDRSPTVDAKTGHSYTVDFITRVAGRECFVNVLSAPSKQSVRLAFQKTLTAWYELRRTPEIKKSTNFISLFDDANGFWRPSDLDGLKPLSSVSRWSMPREFLSHVTGTAA